MSYMVLLPQDLRRVNLTDEFHVLSLNRDKKGLEFISTLEHRRFPFYGLQFHPEKNLYEWVTSKNIPHGTDASVISQYFANFFVNEGNNRSFRFARRRDDIDFLCAARKNSHGFRTKQEELHSLIYNYPVTYTALRNSSFQQSYMFKKSDRNGLLIENDV